ncbi:MAG TPA: biopolymer transporter ExbD [Pyrinomonadaceae bacterium]|jgi:biopolymer transport protein ExbD|nr:biopolymer transporter ExbD [Pyrinomonadaceae bacterium]
MSKPDLRQEQRSVPYINVTPLIDVLLVLLIIFMVVTPQKPHRFKAMIPEPPPDTIVEPNPLTLVVTIDNDLRLRLNKLDEDMGSVNDTSKLSLALSALFQKRKAEHTYRNDVVNPMDLPEDERTVKTVFIKAPRSISYGAVARVIDGVKGAGAQPIGLQIDDLN